MRYQQPLLFLFFLPLFQASAVYAHEQGDWIVRAGATNFDPDCCGYEEIDTGGLGRLRGSGLGEDDWQLGLNLSYMLTDRWGVELLMATPFEHDLNVMRPPEPGIGMEFYNGLSTKQLPPTVTVTWYPLGGSERAFQPYVGIGINYTFFWDEDVGSDLEAGLGRLAEPLTGNSDPLPADLELDDAWGVAFQAGFDYMISDRWGVNAAFWYIDSDTDVTLKTDVRNFKYDIDLDPRVYMLGVSYKF